MEHRTFNHIFLVVLIGMVIPQCQAFLHYPIVGDRVLGLDRAKTGQVVVTGASILRLVGRLQQGAALAPTTGKFREIRQQREFAAASTQVALGDGITAVGRTFAKGKLELSPSGVAEGVLFARLFAARNQAKPSVGALIGGKRLLWYALAAGEFMAANIRWVVPHNSNNAVKEGALISISDLSSVLCGLGMRLLDGRPLTKCEKWLYAAESILRLLAVPEQLVAAKMHEAHKLAQEKVREALRKKLLERTNLKCPLCLEHVDAKQMVVHCLYDEQSKKHMLHDVGCVTCAPKIAGRDATGDYCPCPQCRRWLPVSSLEKPFIEGGDAPAARMGRLLNEQQQPLVFMLDNVLLGLLAQLVLDEG